MELKKSLFLAQALVFSLAFTSAQVRADEPQPPAPQPQPPAPQPPKPQPEPPAPQPPGPTDDGDYLAYKKKASEKAIKTAESYIKVLKKDFPGEDAPVPEKIDEVRRFYESFYMLALTHGVKQPWVREVQKESFDEFQDSLNRILQERWGRKSQLLEVHSLGQGVQIAQSVEDEVQVAKFLSALEGMNATYNHRIILHNFAINTPVIIKGMIIGAIAVFIGSTFLIPVAPGTAAVAMIGEYTTNAIMGAAAFGIAALPTTLVRGAWDSLWQKFRTMPRRQEDFSEFKKAIRTKEPKFKVVERKPKVKPKRSVFYQKY